MPDHIVVTNDLGWHMDERTSIPRRGIRDYRRFVEFSRPLTPEELTAIRKFMEGDDCPGWTGVTASLEIVPPVTVGNIYRFSTTYDSSD